MRTGPKPLSLQLGLVISSISQRPGSEESKREALESFFSGLKRYQSISFSPVALPKQIFWSSGEASVFSLLHEHGRDKGAVFFVPSMINKSSILDITNERSLFRWFYNKGYDSFLFDWGIPDEDIAQKHIESAVQERLLPAIQNIGRPVILIGYCMGGLFAAASAVLKPEMVRGLVLLATPWDFSFLDLMRPSLEKQLFYPAEKISGTTLQALFAASFPDSTAEKFIRFDKMEDPEQVELFVAVEDWLNDNVDLPYEIARFCALELCKKNMLINRGWKIDGKTVHPDNIRMPSLIIAGTKDRIVPASSAVAFGQKNITDLLLEDTGHIGLIASKNALKNIWEPAEKWMAKLVG